MGDAPPPPPHHPPGSRGCRHRGAGGRLRQLFSEGGPDDRRGLLAYSQCMHAHGEPNFPDPAGNGTISKDQIMPLVNSPQFGVASQACQHLMPTSGLGHAPTGLSPQTRFVDLMSFVRCVRQHGFPRFPDPTRSGELTVEMITRAGIDLHQPAVLRAADACVGASHGVITRTTVARVVSGQ